MYRLREMAIDDKVCEQVSMTMLSEVYPTEVIEQCVQQSEPWSSKVRRVRLSTALTLVAFVISMALWSRRNQCRLADGSVLAWVSPACPSSAHYPVRRGMWVRIISYRVTDERLGEQGKVYRLVTTLLNPRVAPALELVALYHERWEVELVIDEIKTHERAQRKVLRSKTPAGVRKAPLWDLPGPLCRARQASASCAGGSTGS